MRHLELVVLAVLAPCLVACGCAHVARSQGAKPPATRDGGAPVADRRSTVPPTEGVAQAPEGGDRGGGGLAFWKGETDELWTCRLDGAEQRRLSAPGERVMTAVGFSGRSGLLAWWSQVEGEPGYQLRIWPARGGAPRTIFTDTLASYADADAPAFTPDGRFIIFGRSTQEFRVADWGLWQIGVRGDQLRQLAKGFGRGLGSHMASVSPDGKFIAFYWNVAEADCELCLVKATGGEVTRTGLMISDLTWSPQGQVVVSQFGGRDGYDIRLARYDPSTKRTTPLTQYSAGRTDTWPSFSPGGREMAYLSFLQPGDGPEQWALTLIEVATGRTASLVRQMTIADARADPDHPELAPQPIAWALDGSRVFLAAVSPGDSNNVDIWSIRPDGSDRRKVVEDAILAGVFER